MINKYVLQHGWDWLAALLSCNQAPQGAQKKIKKMDRGEKTIKVGVLRKLERKQRRERNKV